MKLQYTKLTKTLYKFFYEEGKKYGEFYLDLEEDGTANIHMKDPQYAEDLIEAFGRAMIDPEYENMYQAKHIN
jgi:hypothetical protein